MDINEVREKVKNILIERLMLDIEPSEIKEDAYIFGYDENGDGLGLDSIDALEIVVGIRGEFGIVVGNEEDKRFLKSVNSISEYIVKRLESEKQ